jgi:urease accessory protein UreH
MAGPLLALLHVSDSLFPIGSFGYSRWSRGRNGGSARLHAPGERWKFAFLAHELGVSRDDSLEYLNRYRIQPNELTVLRPWATGSASYLGTTLMSGLRIEPGLAERLQIQLGRLAGVRAAADRLDDRVLLLRLLSESGGAFHEARRWIEDCAACLGRGSDP